MRGYDYGKPLTAMKGYLDALDALPYNAPAPAQPVPLLLAALKPKMLGLSGERTSARTRTSCPSSTRRSPARRSATARVWAPEVSIVLETDPSAAREQARKFASVYLQLPNYTNNLRDLGYGGEDLGGGGSDRLLDAIVGWGDVDAVAARVKAHLDAGADHVCVQPVGASVDVALDELERLAPALLAL